MTQPTLPRTVTHERSLKSGTRWMPHTFNLVKEGRDRGQETREQPGDDHKQPLKGKKIALHSTIFFFFYRFYKLYYHYNCIIIVIMIFKGLSHSAEQLQLFPENQSQINLIPGLLFFWLLCAIHNTFSVTASNLIL